MQLIEGSETTSLLKRQTSKYREKWKRDNLLGFDALDNSIIRCLYKKPGMNITQVWECINHAKGGGIKRLTIYYRINTLERSGYLKTEKGIRNERKCYLTMMKTDEELKQEALSSRLRRL